MGGGIACSTKPRSGEATVPTTDMERKKEIDMFLIIALILAVAWLLGWTAFHIAGGMIHLLLVVAVVSVIVHFVRDRGVGTKAA